MAEFMIFLLNKEYDQGSLEDHLDYLRTWGGTPDCITTITDMADAMEEAEKLVSIGDGVSVVMSGDYIEMMTIEPESETA